MAGSAADARSSDDASADDVEGGDFAARRVGDVCVAAVRMRGGVPRLAEAPDDARDLEVSYEADDSLLRVRDNRCVSNGLDAARRRERSHVRAHSPGREVYGDEPRLLVGSDEHERPAHVRERPRRKRERGRADDELAAVHS